ncbi:XdhC family protein [Lutimonas sp.]|uniref:XdhC family protein n=1 Tax=Lutimonas sp. TaxID=1872403 RepID=UPI003D9AB8C2
MKEIKTILELVRQKKSSREKFAIAQVVNVEGSSYRREGARMIVFESGIFEGGISGGCLEGDTLKRSQLAILKQEPSLVTYDTSKENEIGIGLGCNGVIDVLMTPLNDNSNTLDILNKCLSDRKSHVVVTVTSVNAENDLLKLGKNFYYNTDKDELEDVPGSEFKNFLIDRIQEVLVNNKSNKYLFRATESDLEVGMFVEIIPAQFHLAIFGDNYDVYPMIELARVLDWEISLVGNMQKLKKEKIQAVTNIYHKDFSERPKLDNRTAVILMAHDFKSDKSNLTSALNSEAPYIASLGPKKRFVKMLGKFEEDGKALSENDLDRIFAPSGLEIGANTPEEIALSIFSEILGVFSGKTGGSLKDKDGPIHDRT